MINAMKEKQKYEAPALTAVEFRAETGYASSSSWRGWGATQEIYMLDETLNDAMTMGQGGNLVAGYLQTGNDYDATGGWNTNLNGSWF